MPCSVEMFDWSPNGSPFSNGEFELQCYYKLICNGVQASQYYIHRISSLNRLSIYCIWLSREQAKNTICWWLTVKTDHVSRFVSSCNSFFDCLSHVVMKKCVPHFWWGEDRSDWAVYRPFSLPQAHPFCNSCMTYFGLEFKNCLISYYSMS